MATFHRFSAQHIRQQPEYQFLKSGVRGEYSRVSIDIASLAYKQSKDYSECPRPFTSSCTGNRKESTDDRHAHVDATAIKIVQKVNKKYATIANVPRPQTSQGLCTISECVTEESGPVSNRKTSTLSRKSSGVSSTRRQEDANFGRSTYDPALEKSKVFLHKKNDMFSKTAQYLSPARPGLRKLELHYTDINTTHNDKVIFADLLVSNHRKNVVISDEVYSLERRLYTKRADFSRSTTFWDRDNLVRPASRAKTARTVADKKKERKKKIKEKDDKIKLGYVPRVKSLRVPGTAEMEELRYNCRYLRIPPKYQEHLYNTGLVFYSQEYHSEPEPEIATSKSDSRI